MATLPDGASISSRIAEGWNARPLPAVSSRIAEGWNARPLPAVSSRIAEGWESKLLIMGTFTLSISATEIPVGEAVTFTGTSVRDDGFPAAADVEITRPDGTTETITANVDSSGNFSAEYTASVSGEHEARGVNRVAGLRQTEPWDAVSPPGGAVRISEGWEEA